MRIHIKSDKPLTLSRLTEPLLRVGRAAGEKRQIGAVHIREQASATADQLARQAELYRAQTDELFWRLEMQALLLLLERFAADGERLVVDPLIVPAGLPTEWMPLLEGCAVREWRQTEDPLSPLALLWLKRVGAVFGDPFPATVREVQAGDGVAVLRLDGENAVKRVREEADHREEHVDEAMYLVQANLDDASPEWVAYAMERLFAAGANDVSVLPMTMKKSRQAAMLQVLCCEGRLERIKDVLFRETSTFGLRYFPVHCHRLARRFVTVRTDWGEVPVKVGYRLGERVQIAPEHDACANLARASGVPLKLIYQQALERAKSEAPKRL